MVMSDLPNGKALAKCYYIDENNKYSLNQRICKIKIKDDSIINSKYLFYLLDRNPYYLRFDDGVNQTNLKKDDILSLNLVLPSIKDQERNSKTLTIIDNFIEKENNKLSKLNLLKKGLMQSMFVQNNVDWHKKASKSIEKHKKAKKRKIKHKKASYIH